MSRWPAVVLELLGPSRDPAFVVELQDNLSSPYGVWLGFGGDVLCGGERHPSPDLTLVGSASALTALLCGGLDGESALSAVCSRDSAQAPLRLVPPLGMPLATSLPRIPGASAIVEFREHGTLAGAVVYTWQCEDGRLAAAHSGPAADPDVRVEWDFADATLYRAGELSAVDALHGRPVWARHENVLNMIGGLLETPEFKQHLIAQSRADQLVRELQRWLAVPATRQVLRELHVRVTNGS